MLILIPGNLMSTRARSAAILFAQLIFIHSLWAQARSPVTPLPDLSPLPFSEQLSSMREPLPVDTIVDASLAFSGATDADAFAAKEKLAALVHRFSDEVADVTSQSELGEKVLTFLHKNLFTGYSTLQTRVDTALQTGIYNCVSSAILYMIVARSVGLSVAGVRTTDHAFCTVMINGQPVDVETTNALGFNPGAKREFTDSFGKVTGYSYVPPGDYRDRQNIGEKELLSLILYNRVSESWDVRAYKDALQPAVSAFTLLGSDESRKLLTGAFTNYISWLGIRQQFAQAVQFTDSVKAAFGRMVDIEQPRRDIYHNWIVSLVSANAYQDAEAILAQPAVRATLTDSDWTELSVDVFQLRAQSQADTGDYTAAAATVADGLKKLGRPDALLRSYEVYVHDAVALLYNSRKLTEARTAVDQGLSVYPDSRMLQQDLDLIRKSAR
jgi:hypothetical protein